MPKNRILKRKDGRYQYKTTDQSGTRHAITSKAGETRSAFSLRCEALDALEPPTNDIKTLDDLFTAWLELYVKIGLSEAYRRSCEFTYRRYVAPYFGRKPLQSIKRKDVYQLLAHYDRQGLSASTLQKIRACFSSPYNWAVNALDMDVTPPTQGLVYRKRGKTDQGRDRVISEEEMERFFKAAQGSKYYNYFQVLRLTGLRPSEALGLKVSDIQEDVLTIRRGVTIHGLSPLKTKTARRDLPLYPGLRVVLEAQVAATEGVTEEGWLFPAEDGKPSMNAVKNAMRRVLAQTAVYTTGGHNGMKKLEQVSPPLHLSLYDFRHTYATRLAENKVNPKALQYLMGHKDIETTLHYYVGITHNMLDEAKEIMEELA